MLIFFIQCHLRKPICYLLCCEKTMISKSWFLNFKILIFMVIYMACEIIHKPIYVRIYNSDVVKTIELQFFPLFS
jgi:hypothetical protein